MQPITNVTPNRATTSAPRRLAAWITMPIRKSIALTNEPAPASATFSRKSSATRSKSSWPCPRTARKPFCAICSASRKRRATRSTAKCSGKEIAPARSPTYGSKPYPPKSAAATRRAQSPALPLRQPTQTTTLPPKRDGNHAPHRIQRPEPQAAVLRPPPARLTALPHPHGRPALCAGPRRPPAPRSQPQPILFATPAANGSAPTFSPTTRPATTGGAPNRRKALDRAAYI